MCGGNPAAVPPHHNPSETSTVLTLHGQEFKGNNIFTPVPPSCLPTKCCGLHVGMCSPGGAALSAESLFSNLRNACWCSGMRSVICSSADRALWSEPEPITQLGRHMGVWSVQQMFRITATAMKIRREGVWPFSPKPLLILIWKSCLVPHEVMKEPYGGHMMESSPLKDCQREIKESESRGRFASSFCWTLPQRLSSLIDLKAL